MKAEEGRLTKKEARGDESSERIGEGIVSTQAKIIENGLWESSIAIDLALETKEYEVRSLTPWMGVLHFFIGWFLDRFLDEFD